MSSFSPERFDYTARSCIIIILFLFFWLWHSTPSPSLSQQLRVFLCISSTTNIKFSILQLFSFFALSPCVQLPDRNTQHLSSLGPFIQSWAEIQCRGKNEMSSRNFSRFSSNFLFLVEPLLLLFNKYICTIAYCWISISVIIIPLQYC